MSVEWTTPIEFVSASFSATDSSSKQVQSHISSSSSSSNSKNSSSCSSSSSGGGGGFRDYKHYSSKNDSKVYNGLEGDDIDKDEDEDSKDISIYLPNSSDAPISRRSMELPGTVGLHSHQHHQHHGLESAAVYHAAEEADLLALAADLEAHKHLIQSSGAVLSYSILFCFI